MDNYFLRCFIFIFVVFSTLQICYCGDNDPCYRFCDESHCTCNDPSMFQCKNGQCIPFSKFKDFTIDCEDKSDEAVICCDDQFKCDSKGGIGKCIDHSLLDNGEVNCLDGTDETTNNQQTCMSLKQAAENNQVPNDEYFYTCTTVTNGSPIGKCIPITNVLDGVDDCPNGDDEDPSQLDECKMGKDNCDADHGICTNIPDDTYSCTCQVGYTGNGYTCILFENINVIG